MKNNKIRNFIIFLEKASLNQIRAIYNQLVKNIEDTKTSIQNKKTCIHKASCIETELTVRYILKHAS